jgi:hypothetical protein
MNLFIDIHQKLISALLSHTVEFIIIGGYSVIFHGYTRTTGDIDIWLKPENHNKKKLLLALEEFGIDEASLRALEALDFTQTTFFKIGKEPERMDFLTRINLVEYGEADKQKIVADLDDLKVPFLHLNHLILSKINTDRPQDKADIEMLQKINQKKGTRP